MMPDNSYKPLETVLGFYDFGDAYTVFISPKGTHPIYTDVHEKTHARLGWATSFGIFQKLLAHLARAETIALSNIGKELQNASIEVVRDVHEATATYNEFMQAHADEYVGLPDMERNLPSEYRLWCSLYDNVLQRNLPPIIRAEIAVHVSCLAMNTDILSDYQIPSATKFQNFRQYLSRHDKSPQKRFIALLRYIEGQDQSRLFGAYISEYHRAKSELEDTYASNSYDARKRRRQISISLNAALEEDARELPFAAAAIEVSRRFVELANSLIEDWKAYSQHEFHQTFNYFFRNTDADEVDVLAEYRRVIFDCIPQSGLFPLPSIAALPQPKKYVAVIIVWREHEPFVLSPTRILQKGDCYVRAFPVSGNGPDFFLLTRSQNHIQDIFNKDVGGILVSVVPWPHFT